MKVAILIPSKGRAFQFRVMTLEWLKGFDYRVLVEPQDYESYQAEIGEEKLIKLPEDNRGTAYSLNHGKEWAKENGYDAIFKIDDDINGWTTMDKTDNLTNTERFKKLLEDVEKPMENPLCGGISFGYQFEFYHDKKWTGVNKRFQTCYLVKVENFHPRVYPKGEVNEDMWEDFIAFLRVIEDGKKVLRYGRYLMDTEVGLNSKTPGGLYDFYRGRTPEYYKAVIELVRGLFPYLKWKIKKNGFVEPDFNNVVIRGT